MTIRTVLFTALLGASLGTTIGGALAWGLSWTTAATGYISPLWCHNEDDIHLSGVCSAIGKTWPI